MAYIPSIKRSPAPLPNIQRRGQTHISQTEESDNSRKRVTFTERRLRHDRRKKNIKILFNRRKSADRRNSSLNQQTPQIDHAIEAGQMIDTTA